MDSLHDTTPAPGISPSLTYEPFYRLRQKPFSLSADPRFLFRSAAHAPAFDELLAGIRRREGLIVLTGEIGTGKTTLCRSVLQQLDRRTFAAFVPDPFVSREDLLKTLLVDFGVISIADLTHGRFNGASRSDLSYPLYEFLDSLVPLQAFAVVIIDEAQNLSLPLLEEIRILSELERREKLLQVVLVGQPELRANLKLPQMRQVEQRVSVRCELTALDAGGVAGYVNHRLLIAGHGESRAEFTGAALAAVFDGSSGVPRLINRICDRALHCAYVARSTKIDAPFVWDAVEDLGLGPAGATHDRASREELSAAAIPRPLVIDASASTSAPASAPPRQPTTVIITEPDTAPTLADFAAETDHAAAAAAENGGFSGRYAWAAGAFLALLGVAGSAAGTAWYARAQSVDDAAVASMLPSQPADVSSRPGVAVPQAAPTMTQALRTSAVPAADVVSTSEEDYTILVASFESRGRADRLVEELMKSGYRARALERDWGPPRGRMVQVEVGGYASAIDVERDLQQIRELPGGYNDARIMERQ